MDELREQLGIAIRQYAKEQITWFKRMPGVAWLNSGGDYYEEACRRIAEWGNPDHAANK
jgi:tRNA A37 N6-isopentenylltransferase MiaA